MIDDSFLRNALEQSYEIEGDSFVPQEMPSDERLSVFDEEDKEILMHKEAHFAGSFPLMIECYKKNGKGAVLDTSLTRLQTLFAKEKELNTSLAPFFLSGADAEMVAASKKLYTQLALLFEQDAPPLSKAIASLILAEKKEEKEALKEVLEYQEKAIDLLIDVLKTPQLLNPLFPGYGKTPLLAGDALGILQAEKAIPHLFALSLEEDPAFEECARKNLKKIGTKAKDFLKKILEKTPISKAHESALFCLSSFSSPSLSSFFFSLLQEKYTELPFALYLALGCELLPQKQQEELKIFAKKPDLPDSLEKELQFLIKTWDKKK